MSFFRGKTAVRGGSGSAATDAVRYHEGPSEKLYLHFGVLFGSPRCRKPDEKLIASSLRLAVGFVFPKGPGKIYFCRYQINERRKTVSPQTAGRAEAFKKVQASIPIVKAAAAKRK